MAKKFSPPVQLYMIIDVTSPETTKVLSVTDSRRAIQRGFLYKSQGRKVIAPPLEGRGFSKLDKLSLQYLFWSVCQVTPPEDYAELVQTCIAAIRQIPVDDTPLETLEAEVQRTCPDLAAGNPSVQKEPKEERKPGDPAARPKATSLTGIVWIICDELYAASGQMPGRKEAIEACTKEEINPATASTQYSKWKASKLTAVGS